MFYYGEDYDYDLVSDDFVFLNPNDNWLDSSDIFLQYINYYLMPPIGLPQDLMVFIGCDPQFSAYIPQLNFNITKMQAQITPFLAYEPIDLPILIYDSHKERFLPQWAQPHLNLLMLAAWQGHIGLMQYLLDHSAKIHLQTHRKGQTVLNFILNAPIAEDLKIQGISILLDHQPPLLVQDSENNTFIHCLIERMRLTAHGSYLELLKNIIDRFFVTKESINDLLNKINNKNQDVFILAIHSGMMDLIQVLSPLIKSENVEFYLELDCLKPAFIDFQKSNHALEPLKLLLTKKLSKKVNATEQIKQLTALFQINESEAPQNSRRFHHSSSLDTQPSFFKRTSRKDLPATNQYTQKNLALDFPL